MSEVTIWHNNRCGKSRDAKKLLEEKNVPHGTFEYLKEKLSTNKIEEVMVKLGISDVKDMLRKKEADYKSLDINNKSQDEIISLLIDNPKLIERPIIIKGDKAVIARPIDNLIDLLQ